MFAHWPGLLIGVAVLSGLLWAIEIAYGRRYIFLATAVITGFTLFWLEASYLPSARFPKIDYVLGISGALALVLLSGAQLMERVFYRIASQRIEYGLFASYCLTFLALPLAAPVYSLYVARAQFFRYPLVTGFQGPNVSPDGTCPLFALLSDVHLTDQPQTLEGFPQDDCRLERVLRRLGDRNPPRFCIMLGDLTDRGSTGEWQLWDEAVTPALEGLRGKNTQIVLVPGNHDLQGSPQEGESFSGDANRFEMAFFDRAASFFREAVRWERDFQLSGPGVPLSQSRLSYHAYGVAHPLGPGCVSLPLPHPVGAASVDAGPRGDRFAAPGSIKMSTAFCGDYAGLYRQAADEFNNAFPAVFRDGGTNTAIAVLNSSARIFPGGSMGYGALDRIQLERLDYYLQSLVRDVSLKYLIVTLHHAPVRRETDARRWGDALRRRTNSDVYEHTFPAIDEDEAIALMQLLDSFKKAGKDVEVILAHGHRHARSFSQTAVGVWVIEAPALVEVDGYWMGYDNHGRLALEWRQR